MTFLGGYIETFKLWNKLWNNERRKVRWNYGTRRLRSFISLSPFHLFMPTFPTSHIGRHEPAVHLNFPLSRLRQFSNTYIKSALIFLLIYIYDIHAHINPRRRSVCAVFLHWKTRKRETERTIKRPKKQKKLKPKSVTNAGDSTAT